MACNENFDLALDFFNKAVKTSPNTSEIWFQKSLVQFRVGKAHEASESLEKAINLNSDYYEALIEQELIFSQIGKIEQAKSCYQKVLEIRPKAQIVNYLSTRNIREKNE